MPRSAGLPPSSFLLVKHIGPGVLRNPWAGEPDWQGRRLAWKDCAVHGGWAEEGAGEGAERRTAAALEDRAEDEGVRRPAVLRAALRTAPRLGTAQGSRGLPSDAGAWSFVDRPLQRPSDLAPELRPITVRRLLAGRRPTLDELKRWYLADSWLEGADAAGGTVLPTVAFPLLYEQLLPRKRRARRQAQAGLPEGIVQAGELAFVQWLGADPRSAWEVVKRAEALALEQAGRFDPCGDFWSWYAEILLRVNAAAAPLPGKRRRQPVPAEAEGRGPACRVVLCPAVTRLVRPGRGTSPADRAAAADLDPLRSTAAVRAWIGRQVRPAWRAGRPPPAGVLAAAARCRDPRAWAEVFYRWDGQGWRTALTHAPGTWAEDALQEAWAKLWEGALEKYDPSRPFGPWFLQVVKNTARNLARGERRKLEHLEKCVLAFPNERERAEQAGGEHREREEEVRAGRAAEEGWSWWGLA